jgi:hypothetical protein
MRLHTTGTTGPRLYPFKPQAKLFIMLWRTALFLSYFRQGIFTRSLLRYERLYRGKAIRFDASLGGLGFVVTETLLDGVERAIGAGSVDIGHFGFGTDSSWQNTSEFCAATV